MIRGVLSKDDDVIVFDEIQSAGELNYAFTVIINNYLERNGLNYQHINDVMGALEGAKQEFYTRVAVPYEKGKIVANGDVYNKEFIGG